MVENTPMFLTSLEYPDTGFDSNQYACFSVRINKKSKEVEVCRNNKVMQKFAVSDFVPAIDPNSVEELASMIRTVRETGIEGLANKFNLTINK